MAAIIKTANTHQTSLLVSEQIPDFIRGDHPKFVTFIEKYYEFLAQANSGIATSDGLSHYYGADHATKVITDINDIDTTDLDKFIGSFQKQYGHGLPQQVADAADRRLLYKNLVDFYRAVGTEDSFKMLFRLLFNDEIELYYPFQDVLIASGGNYTKESRIRVNYVENLNDIENTRIVGATSGAYGTVERVQVLPGGSDSFITGRIGNTSTSYTSGVSNTEIYDPMKYLEHGSSTAHIYMTDQSGNFDFFEDIYVDDVNSTVSNTIVLPMTKSMLVFEDFQYGSTNNVISMYDGLVHQRANSTNPPWGSANIDYSNTGIWHTTGDGTGEIKLVSNVYGSYGGVVLEIGNNSTLASATGDQRHIVFAKNVGIGGEDRLYRMSIRARDLGGNSAVSVAEGNRFSAGVSCVRHDLRKLSADNYKDQWEDPLWLVSHKQAIDDEFFVYTAYFKGRETRRNVGGSPYSAKNYGNGGRRDLTSGTRYYNSAQKAVDREVLLPFNTTFIKPTFKVNEPGDGATYSQGITQIDFISLEELTPMQTQLGMHSGSYSDERSLLSTTGAHIQDGHYWQIYAYDIRSKQQIKDYATVVREAVHPAGMKMFGTTISESSRRMSDMIDVKPGKITQLTDNSLLIDQYPAWSPDGTQIAFSRYTNPALTLYEIFKMDVDGTNVRSLIPASGSGLYPAWSPDGTKIAFESKIHSWLWGDADAYAPVGSYQNEIYVMDAGGVVDTDEFPFHTAASLTRLTHDAQSVTPLRADAPIADLPRKRQPAWSPDGTKIAFVANTAIAEGEFRDQIYVINADGTNQTRLTNSATGDRGPSWSPDGTKIGFYSYPHPNDAGSGNYNKIFVMNADGTNRTKIPNHSPSIHPPGVMNDYYPRWSPDGTKVAIQSWNMAHADSAPPNHNFDIKVMNEDGSNPIWLTSNVAVDRGPAWSPDGTQIAFSSSRGVGNFGNTDIYVIDVKERSNTNLLDTFSPESLDSLAGWWSADSVVPENFQVKRDVPGGTSNAVFGSTKNRLPLGWFSDFDDTGVIVPDDFDHIGQTYRNVSANNASVSSMLFSDGGDARDRLGLAADTKNKRGLDKNILKLTSDSWTTLSQVGLHYNPDDQKYWQAGGRSDYYYPIVLEPFKMWVLSYWEMTSNVMTEVAQGQNYSGMSATLATANSSTVLRVNSTHSHVSSEYGDSDFYSQVGHVRGYGLQENYVWQRNATTLDMRRSPATRARLSISIPHRIPAGGDYSANVVQWFDGFMLEEYSNTVHGWIPGLTGEGTSGTAHGYDAVFPYKTPYVKPGYSGANVISWNDRSPNKHHVYANTHGGIFYTPQYVANAINGMPAIRFSANTVINNPTPRRSAYVWSDHTGSASKVYEWSSIGGPGTDKPPTVGLQATKSLASNTLSVPVANTWTVMAVVQSNLTINSSFYDSTLNPMIINSGYGGNKDSLSDGALNQPGTLSLGYDVDGTMGAVLINTTNSTGGIEQTNTATVSTFGAASPNTARPLTNTSYATGKNVFRIVGVSINAASGSTSELLNFHVDGRRFSNSEINNISNDLSRTGLSNQLQQNYVTSIGAWAPSNNTIWDTGTHGVNAKYPYGTASWDGDIAEIVVFNEKLSNTKIALVEGYLAHKYRLQEHLIHKDGTTNETEVYRWEYANTQNGWEFLNQHSSVPITYVWEGGDSNNYIQVTGSGQQTMQITLPTHIHGAAYDKVGFRYKMTAAGMEPTSNTYAFKWKNDDSETLHSLPDLGDDGHNGLNVWTEKYFDLSGQAEWVGKKITYLRYDMNAGVETVNQIDWVYVSGNNHPHPYRYNAPTAVGANNWNINY